MLSVLSDLRIERDYECAPETLWRAWIDEKLLVTWFGPERAPASNFVTDVRPGGTWRACLDAGENGGELRVSGKFEHVEENVCLVFTFRWDHNPDEGGKGVNTRVGVDFIPLTKKRTRLVLTQSNLANPESAARHTEGWNSCLDRLATAVAASAQGRTFIASMANKPT